MRCQLCSTSGEPRQALLSKQQTEIWSSVRSSGSLDGPAEPPLCVAQDQLSGGWLRPTPM